MKTIPTQTKTTPAFPRIRVDLVDRLTSKAEALTDNAKVDVPAKSETPRRLVA